MTVFRATTEQRQWIFDHYKGRGNQELTDMFNRRFGTSVPVEKIKSYKNRNKLDSGITGRYKKGNTPWNKGMKGLSLGGEETQFKPGHKPHNWVPIGAKRLSKDGYIQIKVAEGRKQHNWRSKHVLVWEAHNGRPVPEGHVVIFGDGNNRNFDPDNLLLVTQAQLLRLNQNGLIQNHVERTKAGITIADILNKTGEKRRECKNRG